MKRHKIKHLENEFIMLSNVAKNSLGDTDWEINSTVKKIISEKISFPDRKTDSLPLSIKDKVSATIEIIFTYKDKTLTVEGNISRIRRFSSEYFEYAPYETSWNMEFSTKNGFSISNKSIIDSHQFLTDQEGQVNAEVATLYELLPSSDLNSQLFKSFF